MSAIGNLYLEIQQQIIDSKNTHYDSECNYCVTHYRDSMSPSHYASLSCESGGHNHCTCDICF